MEELENEGLLEFVRALYESFKKCIIVVAAFRVFQQDALPEFAAGKLDKRNDRGHLWGQGGCRLEDH